MDKIILTTKEELHQEIKSVFLEIEKEKKASLPPKVYSINQVAKRLGLAHATVKKLVMNEVIKTTKSGLITENEVNNYLYNK